MQRIARAASAIAAASWIGFDNALAHRIYGGADILLMPSIYEPCGLNQMYALRYGTVPVVRLTGGLADTVIPFDGTNATVANGFGFVAANPADLYLATWIAMLNYRDSKTWKACDLQDIRAWPPSTSSWERSAAPRVAPAMQSTGGDHDRAIVRAGSLLIDERRAGPMPVRTKTER